MVHKQVSGVRSSCGVHVGAFSDFSRSARRSNLRREATKLSSEVIIFSKMRIRYVRGLLYHRTRFKSLLLRAYARYVTSKDSDFSFSNSFASSVDRIERIISANTLTSLHLCGNKFLLKSLYEYLHSENNK